ncbi:hypothetical protein SDC9_131116 [bioreactor metagenome]|uniref:Uncharacterized protein n=1 Tax=bioreactor metagenome TaxID=1076179 RepID=A0A645D4B3_9ZZZZ
MTGLDGNVFHLGQRLAAVAVQHEDLTGLGTDHQRWRRLAVLQREIDQCGSHGKVEVPQVVVHGLIHPFLLARGSIQREDGGTVLQVRCRARGAIQVHRSRSHGQVHRIGTRVVGRSRPDIGR